MPNSSPLLGTRFFQDTETIGKSLVRRSENSVCYTTLLHNYHQPFDQASQQTVNNGQNNCYTKVLHKRQFGLFLRGRIFYHRRRVPHELVKVVGKTEIWKSLRTDSFHVAKRRVSTAAASVEAVFENARKQSGFSVDTTLLRPLIDDLRALSNSNIDTDCPTTFAEAYDKYLADPTHTWTASTREAYRTTRNMMVSIIGADLPIKTLSRTHARDVVETLRWMPRNASKLFPKLTPTQASTHARQNDGTVELISASNANSYLGNFSSFMNWAVNEEMADRNPARALRIPDPVAKRDKRHPFSREQLQTIFAAPIYTGCVDGERGYAKVGTMRPRSARFWVPIIALHTGMRLNEICQMDVADIRQIEGVHCFVITANHYSQSATYLEYI